MKVSEIREKNIIKLAERSDSYTTNAADAIRNARKAMTSFYRLAGFSERLFYINNDERLYNRYAGKMLDTMEEREARWIERVNGYLKEFHARAVFNGIYPSVCEEKKENDHGCIKDLFLTSWY